jgi:hypothetical protein
MGCSRKALAAIEWHEEWQDVDGPMQKLRALEWEGK